MINSIKFWLKGIFKSVNRLLRPAKIDEIRTEPISRKMGTDRGLPIDRFYIEEFIHKYKSHIKGDVLEIGAPLYVKKFGHNISSTTVLHAVEGNSNATLVGDLTVPDTIPAEKYDCIVLTQTFPFIFDIFTAMRTCYSALKTGGVLIATVSGISQISRYDMERWGDYWRFTDRSLYKLAQSCFAKDNIHLDVYGNVFVAKAFLDGYSLDEIPSDVLKISDPDYQLIIGLFAQK